MPWLFTPVTLPTVVTVTVPLPTANALMPIEFPDTEEAGVIDTLPLPPVELAWMPLPPLPITWPVLLTVMFPPPSAASEIPVVPVTLPPFVLMEINPEPTTVALIPIPADVTLITPGPATWTEPSVVVLVILAIMPPLLILKVAPVL